MCEEETILMIAILLLAVTKSIKKSCKDSCVLKKDEVAEPLRESWQTKLCDTFLREEETISMITILLA